MPLLAPSPQGARDGLSPVTGTMRSCRACCWWLSKTQNWTHTHPAWLKSPRLEQGHGSQTCFWHREELTQACNPQELLTQMCPWTGKGLLTPCQLPPKYSPSPSPPLAYVPCPEQLMSLKTGVPVLRLGSAEPVGCPPCALLHLLHLLKAGATPHWGFQMLSPLTPTFTEAKMYYSGFARGGELPVQSQHGPGSRAEGRCVGCAPLMERDHLSTP